MAVRVDLKPYSEELEQSWKDLVKNPDVLLDADAEIMKLVRSGKLYNAPSPFQGQLGPLEYAVKHTNNEETLRALIDARVTPVAFPQADDSHAHNIVYRAIHDGASSELVILLLNAKATPFEPCHGQRHRYLYGALDDAINSKYPQKVIDALINVGGAKVTETTVELARKNGYNLPAGVAPPLPLPEPQKPIIQAGEKPLPALQPPASAVDPEKWNRQLFYAVQRKDGERLIREALAQKANPTLPGQGEYGALHWAIQNGYSDEIIEGLVKAGGKPNNGEGTLQIAISRQRSEKVVALLLDNGGKLTTSGMLDIARGKDIYSDALKARLAKTLEPEEEAPPLIPIPVLDQPREEPVREPAPARQDYLAYVVTALQNAWEWIKSLFAAFVDYLRDQDDE